MDITIDLLRDSPLFKSMSNTMLSDVQSRLKCISPKHDTQIINQEVEDGILDPNAPQERGIQRGALFIIWEGTVRVTVKEEEYNESVSIALLGPGEIVGELSLVDSLGHSATVQTRGKTTLFKMKRNDFEYYIDHNLVMTKNLIRILAQRIRMMNAQAKARAVKLLSGRVGRLLLTFSVVYGRRYDNASIYIPIYLVHSDLASILNISWQQVSAALNQAYGKCVKRDGHYYRITNIAMFAEAVQKLAPGNETESMLQRLYEK